MVRQDKEHALLLLVKTHTMHFGKDFDPKLWFKMWSLSMRVPIAASCGLLSQEDLLCPHSQSLAHSAILNSFHTPHGLGHDPIKYQLCN